MAQVLVNVVCIRNSSARIRASKLTALLGSVAEQELSEDSKKHVLDAQQHLLYVSQMLMIPCPPPNNGRRAIDDSIDNKCLCEDMDEFEQTSPRPNPFFLLGYAEEKCYELQARAAIALETNESIGPLQYIIEHLQIARESIKKAMSDAYNF